MSEYEASVLASVLDAFNKNYDPEILIWRYMSFAKFSDMIHNRRLFFARPQSFQDRDKFEGGFGAITKAEKDRIAKGGHKDLSYKECRDAIERLEKGTRDILETEFYVNCWHENDHENALMWDAYCSTSESLCIQSRPSLLTPGLPKDTYSAKISYVSPDERIREDFWLRNAISRSFCKRSEFQDEKEFRFVFQDFGGHVRRRTGSPVSDQEKLGSRETTNLKRKSVLVQETGAYFYFKDLSFIEKIIVHRRSRPFFLDLVRDMCDHYQKNFGREVDIIRSGI